VRDYVIGPKWWHNLSVRMAYWPISVAVVHQRLPEPSPVPKHVHVVEAPVGVYDLQESPESPEAIRAVWGVGGRAAPESDSGNLIAEGRVAPEHRRSKTGDSGLASNGGNQLADAGEFLEGQSQADLQMDSQKLQSIRTANDTGASKGNSSFEDKREFDSLDPSRLALRADLRSLHLAPAPVLDCGKKKSGTPEAPSPATSHSPPATAPKALALDSGRSTLDTSAPADVVFLAFGFIRDNKNLDLVIRSLAGNPSAVLVVMGRAQSKKDKPLEFYWNLAAELGVQDRVKFFDGFVPDEKLASYFAAADVVVLTYDGTFHSQSGVLNVAARARRPVLASAGESPLKDCVQKFRLGVFVEPDNLGALKEGMAKLINAKCEMRNVAGGAPDWEGYEAFASWDVNAAKILEGVEEVRKKRTPVE
jgi:glycosyltransferase involved in cell wall biosynthesis